MSVGTATFTATGVKRLIDGCYGWHWAATLVVKGTGAVSATVELQGSNTPGDADSWILVDTLTVTGTSPQKDSFVGTGGWANIRANCTAITGTDVVAVVALSSQ